MNTPTSETNLPFLIAAHLLLNPGAKLSSRDIADITGSDRNNVVQRMRGGVVNGLFHVEKSDVARVANVYTEGEALRRIRERFTK